MDELDLIATDPLESPAPTEAEIATALGFIADLLALTPTAMRTWEQRDHGNGLTYRLWDALAVVHGTAAAHDIDEPEALHAVQAAVRRIKTDEEIIDVLVEHLPELGVDRWPAGLRSRRLGPVPGDQAPVPAQHRGGLHDEEHLGQSGTVARS